MLRRYNDERLGKLHIPQVYWLFYQIWGEVTEPRTLSTYQYRLMNTLSILFELKDVLSKTWKRIYPTKNHLGECLDEAREIISQDIVLETKFPDLQRILTAALSENPDGQNDYLVMMAQIDFFLRSVQARYLDSLLEALHDRIIEGTETRAAQAQLLWLTKQIVSVCVYKGGEISVLKTAHRILQKPMDSSEDRWGAFVRALQAGGSYTFFVCIPVFPDCMLRKSHQVDGQADARKARFDKTIESDETIEIKKGSEILRYIHKTEDNAIRNDTQYFVITIQAADMYTASRNAMGRYAALMNILSFYNVIYPWSLEHRKLVVVNGAETGEATIDSIAIDRLYRSFEYREGAARLFEHTFSYLKRAEQQPQTEIQQRIEAAFNYANIGKGTSVQSERFINIWIALEVLCRTQMSGSIIGSILDVIPAALSLRYIYRLYRNFLEDCFRCDISLEFRGICILRTDEKECSVCRLLEILAQSFFLWDEPVSTY